MRETLSFALVFVTVGVLAALPGLAGLSGITTQISWILLSIGILLLGIHFVWRDRPPTL